MIKISQREFSELKIKAQVDGKEFNPENYEIVSLNWENKEQETPILGVSCEKKNNSINYDDIIAYLKEKKEILDNLFCECNCWRVEKMVNQNLIKQFNDFVWNNSNKRVGELEVEKFYRCHKEISQYDEINNIVCKLKMMNWEMIPFVQISKKMGFIGQEVLKAFKNLYILLNNYYELIKENKEILDIDIEELDKDLKNIPEISKLWKQAIQLLMIKSL